MHFQSIYKTINPITTKKLLFLRSKKVFVRLFVGFFPSSVAKKRNFGVFRALWWSFILFLLFLVKKIGEKRLISGWSISLLTAVAHPLILLTVINVFSMFRVFHGDFSLCVDYMQYILSYRSRFRPLSSLCSLVWGRGGGRALCGVGGPWWGGEKPRLFPASLYCSLSETSPGLWNFVLVAFAKTKNGFVESPFFLAASFLSL